MKRLILLINPKKTILIGLIAYYLLVFVLGVRFLFYISFLLICIKTCQLFFYTLIKKKISELNNTELFLFTLCTLNMGFAFLILFVKTNNYTLMFHAIFQFLLSIFYLIKLNNKNKKQACTEE
jgi:hypothetical protein